MESAEGTTNSAPPPAPTDDQCVARVLAGDLHAFAHLHDRHHHHAAAVAVAIAGRQLAPTLVDEAFGRLLLSLLGGRAPSVSVRAFLFASLRESYRQRRGWTSGGASFEGDWLTPAVAVPPLPAAWQSVLRHRLVRHLQGEPSDGSGAAGRRPAPRLSASEEEELLVALAGAARAAPFLCRATRILLRLVGVTGGRAVEPGVDGPS